MTYICYSISAPETFSTEQMLQIARYAHQTAHALGFQRVEPLFALEPEDVQQLLEPTQEKVVDLVSFSRWVELLSLPMSYELYAIRRSAKYQYIGNEDGVLESVAWVYPQRLVGFHAVSGRGCTELSVVFAQYPADIHALDSRLTVGWWADNEVHVEDAPMYGVEHLVQCHLRHVLLLRALRQRFSALQVQVKDPTGYWKSGSVPAVLRWARRLVCHSFWQERAQKAAFRGKRPYSPERTVAAVAPERPVLRELLSCN